MAGRNCKTGANFRKERAKEIQENLRGLHLRNLEYAYSPQKDVWNIYVYQPSIPAHLLDVSNIMKRFDYYQAAGTEGIYDYSGDEKQLKGIYVKFIR
jgi:hypothetical protein